MEPPERLILTVDDEPDLLVTYARLLRPHHFQTMPAANLREALAALRAHVIALVVTDLRLPDGDGLDVIRIARTVEPPPPVIAVTGFPSGPSQRDAFAAGAHAYLAKPFPTETFVGLVCALVGGGRAA